VRACVRACSEGPALGGSRRDGWRQRPGEPRGCHPPAHPHHHRFQLSVCGQEFKAGGEQRRAQSKGTKGQVAAGLGSGCPAPHGPALGSVGAAPMLLSYFLSFEQPRPARAPPPCTCRALHVHVPDHVEPSKQMADTLDVRVCGAGLRDCGAVRCGVAASKRRDGGAGQNPPHAIYAAAAPCASLRRAPHWAWPPRACDSLHPALPARSRGAVHPEGRHAGRVNVAPVLGSGICLEGLLRTGGEGGWGGGRSQGSGCARASEGGCAGCASEGGRECVAWGVAWGDPSCACGQQSSSCTCW
jgi:hypothetical protein